MMDGRNTKCRGALFFLLLFGGLVSWMDSGLLIWMDLMKDGNGHGLMIICTS